MKRKYVFLMAASVCLGWFGLATPKALAQATLESSVYIESITKVMSSTPALPIAAGKQIYFDVKLATVAGNGWLITGNEYAANPENVNNRPYLILNIPLTGESSKAGIQVKTAEGEKYTATTDTAVAYYAGPGATPQDLRFVYNVRPGDMTPELAWATISAANQAPAFGGDVKAIRLQVTPPDLGTLPSQAVTTAMLKGNGANNAVDADDAEGQVWSVGGYTMTLGDGGTNRNTGKLYQGLVPVTVATPNTFEKMNADGTTATVANPGATAFQQSTDATNCAVWLMVENGAGGWDYLNSGVTFMEPDNSRIYEGLASTAATFPTDYAAPFTGVVEVNATSFTTQKFFVNVPEADPANDPYVDGTGKARKVRICYGLPPMNDTTAITPYTYLETTVLASPNTENTSGYQVQNVNLEAATFSLAGTSAAQPAPEDPDAPDPNMVSGYELSLSAGDVETISILKNNHTDLVRNGTIYASIKQISAKNGARASWERYYVTVDPTVDGSTQLKISVPADVVSGETIYQISIPGVENDEPVYIKVKATQKREYITITPDATIGTTGYEAYRSDTVSVLPYTLSVNASTSKRYFKIYPVLGNRETRITDTDVVVVTEDNPETTGVDERVEINAHSLLKRAVALQMDTSTDTTTETAAVELRVEVPAGQTSVTFYVLCRNDFPRHSGMLSLPVQNKDGAWIVNGADGTPSKTASYMSGIAFKAKTCNYSGTIIGENDECPAAVAPKVENVAPTITASTVQTSASTDTTLPFTFTVEDVVGDYLLASMVYGDGATEVHLYVDEAEMTAVLGANGWATHLNDLKATYGDDLIIKPRSKLTAQQMRFDHAYDVSAANWSLTVSDSTGHSATLSGLLTLIKAQSLTFYTINKATQPASGRVVWENKGGDDTWGFGDVYTYNSLPLSPSESNTIRVRAKPYRAGETSPAVTSDPTRTYGPISPTLDSFFYKWGAWSDDYLGLLPNDNGIYSTLLTVNRAFVSGGGEANDPTKWQDIELAAFFVAEFLPGDALNVYDAADFTNPDPANLYNLGDYNRDGIPDGWVLHGGDATARTLIEGVSMATQAAEGDSLPVIGWTRGDEAFDFRNENASNYLGVGENNTPPTSAGAAFNYLTRVRGLDEALNAADGNGNWISVPAWVVLVRAQDVLDIGGAQTPVVVVNRPRSRVRLATSKVNENVDFTAGQKIPFWRGTINGVTYPVEEATDPLFGWAPVVDANGVPICPNPANPLSPYIATSVMVKAVASAMPDGTTDPDFEQFRTSYNYWAYDGNNGLSLPADYEQGTPFPFVTAAGALTGPGAVWSAANGGDDKYYFTDARTPEGIWLDEPFRTGATAVDAAGMLDPRRTSWLDRYAMAGGADTDGDGVANGMEYYFWYYASRIAWISTFTMTDADGNVQTQVNREIWPAIDLRNHGLDLWANTDGALGTDQVFVMGRRYLESYNPDATEHSFYEDDDPANGKGNFWEPIPVDIVVRAFDPFGTSDGDPDNDGLSTSEEFDLGSNPIDCDTDGDWVPDGWVDAYELDPSSSAGGKNPDMDYFAVATVTMYSEFHHLFKVATIDLDDEETTEPDAGTEGGETTTPGEGGTTTPAPTTERVYYYDYEGACFWSIEMGTDANGEDLVTDIQLQTLEEPIPGVENPLRLEEDLTKDDLTKVKAWAAEPPVMLKMQPKTRRLRDAEVFKAFGFNPYTGWGTAAGTSGQTSFTATHTEAFTTREEFNSAVRRVAANDATIAKVLRASTSPVNADTNDDGIPDGWEAYIGYDPTNTTSPAASKDADGDGLSNLAEFQSLAVNQVAAYSAGQGAVGWGKASNDRHNTTWVNKTHPTNPRNPDTDFDGVFDADEGVEKYCYGGGTNANNSRIGGGMNPNRMDTDGDGMPDGWEYRYGTPAQAATTTTPAEGEDGETTETTTEETDVATTGAPDPTRAMDYDLDPDRDGLPNNQEYLTGLLRQNRYDLSLETARLYADNPGETSGDAWLTVPDIYNAVEDLLNPSLTYSVDFVSANGEPVQVNPLNQAMAANTLAIDSISYAPKSITAAFNRKWLTSMVFPTAQQIDAFALNPTPEGEDEEDEAAAELAKQVDLLVATLQELDAAYQRLTQLMPDGNPFVQSMTANVTVTSLQVRALIDRTEALMGEIAGNADTHPVLVNLLGDALWLARKAVLQAAVAAVQPTDPVPAEMTTLADQSGDPTGTWTAETLTPAEMTEVTEAWETAVRATQSPIIRAQYRDAMRGYTGGLWKDGDMYYIGQLAMHYAIGAVDGRTPKLGQALANAKYIGGYLPQVTESTSNFFTTSPLVADTDADGMDDYFEVFHGINPLLGDFATSSNVQNGSAGRGGYAIDSIAVAYARIPSSNYDSEGMFVRNVLPLANGFGDLRSQFADVTGFDYFSYPWLAGVPQADPDGDLLLNAEEAVNPVGSDPAHYGTDPSPLWMTDPANANSFVTRFYSALNGNMITLPEGPLTFNAFMYVGRVGDVVPTLVTDSLFPYEINEGFDTDGDGVADFTELSSNAILRGDPQSLRSPDRQQAAYFGGEGAMQTHAVTQFGPTSLTTFTIECWIKPEAMANQDEAILIDRPWEFASKDGIYDPAYLRHNFTLGLKIEGGVLKPFVRFTATGTNTEYPKQSPEVIASEAVAAETWTHVAATYDGTKLALVINGEETASAMVSLIPANGVISLKNDGLDTLRRYTYREAPILIGAGPGVNWFADIAEADEDVFFTGDGEGAYADCYKGYIDEVRIWNGARTPSLIAEDRSRTFTQTELLQNRLDVFLYRLQNGGYFAANVPTELLASYSFDDLLASTSENTDAPWESYPGEVAIGGDTVPGSLRYRRTGFKATKAGEALWGATLPEVEELFSSYYALQTPRYLRSEYYITDNTANGSLTEYVPMAHNMVAHLPLMDVELASPNAFSDISTTSGEPELTTPSGSTENLKPADTVYWSPYAAGMDVGSTLRFDVKTTGNPYGYRYNATKTFDALNYLARNPYTTQYATDLLIYGDVYAKYTAESWDSSPSTDPSAGSGTSTEEVPDGTMGWFEFATGTGETLNDTQLSVGGAYLDSLFPGQTKDSDGDRMPNWWENYYTLDPEDPTGNNGPHGDADGDYLTNYAEFLARSNPGKYSTAGNGVPDSQMSIWARRGRPTFGLLYTDNDYMEDHWEAANRSADLSVDFNDATLDADQDGWSNWAEARVLFRGEHGTDPNRETALTALGTVPAYPTPAISLKVDYFGDKSIISNETNKIVVHAYTAVGNNSAPDAVFILPMETKADASEGAVKQFIGRQVPGSTVTGYLEPGNIKPGTVSVKTFQYIPVNNEGTGGLEEGSEWNMRDNIKGELVAAVQYTVPDEDNPEETTTESVERVVGTIDYATGKYTYTIPAEMTTYVNGAKGEDTYLMADYEYTFKAGFPTTYTLVSPVEGSHLREGKNNFFVFMDLNENLSWDDGEPAGVTDQHDVEIGWDTLSTQLHVNLTADPPPGAIRLSVGRILKQLVGDQLAKIAALQAAQTGSVDTSSFSSSTGTTSGSAMLGASTIPHPQNPSDYLDPANFDASLKYNLVLIQHENIGPTTVPAKQKLVYSKQYNVLKPYLTEEDIFSAYPAGLEAAITAKQIATSYAVYLLPETIEVPGSGGDITQWYDYNIAIVTNRFGNMDTSLTNLTTEKTNGGAVYHNTDLVFEWTSNIQVPSFRLEITKTDDGSGAITPVVVYDQEVRGVSASKREAGNGATEQFAYRYKLPRGIGELSKGKPVLFGNGHYTYKLILNPYNGESVTLDGAFRIQLRSSLDDTLCEKPGNPVSFNAYDSYYVRSKIRYNGVLCEAADFGTPAARVVIEAHTTASFNDAPVASTSDLMDYDANPELNGCVRITKDKVYSTMVANTAMDAFWSTLIEAEIRGIPTDDPVYLMAYIDLNQNGKRDTWEPWGYATMGLDDTDGYYFDARAVKPVAAGKDFAVEFYIQDVDTDNDKLADSWEWKNAGMPLGDEEEALFGSWCNTFTGTIADHLNGNDIWKMTAEGNLVMTAFGAQLYGLEVTGIDENGGVTLANPMPEDLALAQELMNIIGADTAIALFKEGYVVYAIDVSDIVYDATTGEMTLKWEMAQGNSVLDGSTIDLAEVFAQAADQNAAYTIYGTDDPSSGVWKPLANVQVAGELTPSTTLTKDALTWETDEEGETSTAKFFKVMLSTKAETLE